MSLMIYCCYHDAKILHFVDKGWLNPDWDHVTYVKVIEGPFTFHCKNHIDLHAEAWFKPVGTCWQEWEFIHSLSEATPKQVLLPEFVGFAHYDMNLAAYTPRPEELNKQTMVVLSNYTVEWAVKQGISAYGKEIIQTLLTMSGVAYPKVAKQLLPLCSAVIVPRWAFKASMRPVSEAMLDRTSILHAPGGNARFAGSLSERYFAVQLLARQLAVIHHPIEHLLVQSDRVFIA